MLRGRDGCLTGMGWLPTVVLVETEAGVEAAVMAPALSANGADGCLLGPSLDRGVLYVVWGCSPWFLRDGKSVGNDLKSFFLSLVDQGIIFSDAGISDTIGGAIHAGCELL